MLREEQIFHLIKSNNCPFWKLSLQEDSFSIDKVIANYNCSDTNKEMSEDAVIEKSISALNKQLEIYKDIPGLRFRITIKPTSTSNKDTVLGPFIFIINGNQNNMPLNGMPGQNQNTDMMGYVPKNQMSEMMELMTQKSAFLLEKALFERDKREFEEDKKLAEAELKELGKEYSNVYNAAKSASKKGIMEAGFKLAKLAGIIDEDVNLGEIDEANKKENQDPDTPEEKAAIKIAELIVSKKLKVPDIESIYDLVSKLIEKKNNNNGTETN